MRVYIAGPMTGVPNSNYPAFNTAAAAWRAAGWNVENPAEHFGGAEDRLYSEYVAVDILALKRCHAIAMLPGWNAPTARGSVWEHAIAKDILNILVYDARYPVSIPRSRSAWDGASTHWDALRDSYGQR